MPVSQPIGISFIPSAVNMRPEQARAEGAVPGSAGSASLADAYKVLSLRLPTVLGAAAPTPASNLTAPGAAGLKLPNGMNPYAALFTALLKAQFGGSSMPMSPSESMLSPDDGGSSPARSATDLTGFRLPEQIFQRAPRIQLSPEPNDPSFPQDPPY